MAIQRAIVCSPMKFSQLLRFWIKQQVFYRLRHFPQGSVQSYASHIQYRTNSSLSVFHSVPNRVTTRISEQHKEIKKLHDTSDNSGSRALQNNNLLHVNAEQATAGSEILNAEKADDVNLSASSETTVDKSRVHDEDMRNTDLSSYKPELLDTELTNQSLPRRLVNIYTDASGRYGLGCVWDKKWVVSQWEDDWLSNNYRCMELLEMKAVLVAILTWGHDWTGSVVRVHCDNKMVVNYFNHRARLHQKVSEVYKSIKLAACELGFELVVEQANKCHVQFQGTDSLSKLDFSRFHKLLPYMNSVPDFPPSDLEFLLPNMWEKVCVSVKLRSSNSLIGFR